MNNTNIQHNGCVVIGYCHKPVQNGLDESVTLYGKINSCVLLLRLHRVHVNHLTVRNSA
jgi:hypothetical protein